MLISTIKKWLKIASPNKNWWCLFISAIFASLFYIVEPVASANIIDAIYTGNLNLTYLWLAIALLFVVLKCISWAINYSYYPKVVGSIFKKIQLEIYEKTEKISPALINRKNKEKLLSTIDSDIFTISNFADTLASSFAGLFRVIIIVIIIATINFYAAFFIVFASLFNSAIISITNRQLIKSSKKLNNSRDAIVEKLSDCIDGSSTITQLNLEDRMKHEFMLRTQDYNLRLEQNTKLLSVKDNWLGILWGILQAGVIYLLINLVFDLQISLPLFLIIVPYITMVISRIEDFSGLFNKSRQIYLLIQRIETVKNLNESEFVEYGKRMVDNPYQKLSISNIKLSSDKDSEFRFNFSIKKNDYKFISTLSGAERDLLIKLLKREQKPSTGGIYLNNVNIYSLDKKSYNNEISFVEQEPYFFDDSIIKNLQLVERNRRNIYSLCKYLGVSEEIKKLPQSYKTNANSISISKKLLFLLGLVRALLSESEVVVIDYYPISINAHDIERINSVVKKLLGRRTVFQLMPTTYNFKGLNVKVSE